MTNQQLRSQTRPGKPGINYTFTMKHLLLFLLLIALLTGCARRYTITLQNGNQITAHGKPKLQGDAYVFKDANGQQGFVSAGRVREIAPASMATSTSDSKFKGPPKK